MQRRVFILKPAGSTQSFPIDMQEPFVASGQPRCPGKKAFLKLNRIQSAKHTSKCVARRNAVGEFEKTSKPLAMNAAPGGDILPALAAAYHRAHRDHDDIEQSMSASAVDSRINHALEGVRNAAHQRGWRLVLAFSLADRRFGIPLSFAFVLLLAVFAAGPWFGILLSRPLSNLIFLKFSPKRPLVAGTAILRASCSRHWTSSVKQTSLPSRPSPIHSSQTNSTLNSRPVEPEACAPFRRAVADRRPARPRKTRRIKCANPGSKADLSPRLS